MRRIIDSHIHIGDIFHENKNITFKTNVTKGDYEDPFIACERSGYTIPLMPKNLDELIHAGQYRCWEWTLENCQKEMDTIPEIVGAIMLPIWPNQTFEEAFATCKLDSRVIPFTTCVLTMPIDEMCKKLKKDIDQGAKGLKLHPTLQNVPLDDPKIEAAVSVFGEADLPVLTHCGANPYYTADSPFKTNPLFSAPNAVYDFCHRFPDFKIIVAHNCSMCESLYEGVKGLKNVYTDTSMCSAEMMRKGVELLGPDKILFGSDAPFGSFKYSVAEMEKAFANEPDIADMCFYQNIAKLIHLED